MGDLISIETTHPMRHRLGVALAVALALAGCGGLHNTRGTDAPLALGKILNAIATPVRPVVVAVIIADPYDAPEYLKKEVVSNAEFRLLKHVQHLTVVSRSQLDHALAELKISLAGLTNEATRRDVGKMLGATHLILLEMRHAIVDGENGYVTVSKLIDVETGRICGVSSPY